MTIDALHSLRDVLDDLLGLDVSPENLTFSQMAGRALAVFFWTLVLLKLANQRIVGRSSGGDVMLLVVLGSVLSRAINGAAAFFPTLGTCAIVVLLHRVLMAAAYKSHAISVIAKGHDRILVRNGEIDWDAMRHTRVTLDDLLEHVRLNGDTTSIDEVREARLERSGGISVVRKSKA